MDVSARYLIPKNNDDPGAPRHGLLTIDGVDYWGPLPPNDGMLRQIFDDWVGAGNNPVDDPGLYQTMPDFRGEPAERQWSFLEFMELFTDEEQLAIAGAAMQSVQVKLWYDKAVGANFILLSDQRTIDGVNQMAAAGLFSQERAAKVLKGEGPS